MPSGHVRAFKDLMDKIKEVELKKKSQTPNKVLKPTPKTPVKVNGGKSKGKGKGGK